jgi:triacylglycerol lipase
VLSDIEAAELGLLVLYAADMYDADRDSLTPSVDPRLSSKWRILGYLTGTDTLFRVGRTIAFGEDVCYGYLAQEIADPTVFVVAIRGTDGILEWIEDAQFVAMRHPVAGHVETGFYSIYQSLTYRPTNGGAFSAALGIAAAVGRGELIVLGHSLGSALATYLTFDLAPLLGDRVQGCYFASPRPGDAAFVNAFAQAVKTYNAFAYELDLVPRIPRGPNYTDLPGIRWLGIGSVEAAIKFSFLCFHHIISYAAMLHYSLMEWGKIPAADQPCAACIKGPKLLAS